MKVNFFIIGQPKSGTTALYDYLKKHPQLFLPEQKQLYYFAMDHNNQRQKNKKFRRKYYKKYYNYNFEDYIAHFDFAQKEKKYFVDITPDYFYSKTAPEEIYKYNPEAKIILLLREPLRFLKSFHNQMINSGCEKEFDFRKAFDEGRRGERALNVYDSLCPELFYYYENLTDYLSFVKPWCNLFGENFKVILYEDFKHDNFGVLNSIYNFLDIKNLTPKSTIISNVSTKPDNSIKTKILKTDTARFVISLIPIKLKKRVKNILKGSQNDILHNKANENEKIKDVLLENILKKELKEKVENLNQYLNERKLFLNNEKIDLIKYWNYV